MDLAQVWCKSLTLALADPNTKPNELFWDFPTAGLTTVMRNFVIKSTPEVLNRTNSRTFKFGIIGRAGCDIELTISITAQPVGAVLDSCTWTINALGSDTRNLAGPLNSL